MWKGYAHYLVEYLPRLMMIKSYSEAKGCNVTLLSGSEISDIEKEIIDFVFHGESKPEIQLLDDSSSYLLDQVFLPSFLAPSGLLAVHPWASRKIRDLAADLPTVYNDTKLIYISRSQSRNSSKRNIVNEEELVDLLGKFGFVKYELENLSLAEKIQLFSSARVVIGPSGAGFSHLIFSSSCTAIEILPYSRVPVHNYALAKSMGHKYIPIASSRHGDKRSDYYQPISADLLTIESTLNSILIHPPS
ncbi:glycosyltransferase family 61 protein [Synechococcus sp. CCY9202]|uniref:glycosyltransferase family 61 protein n=1 Tax=Synechococcus sp. CCY9202 TaxID=174698 RepID=UPI002B20D74F|nr:glycosyltransferase family 61 protein [Synechococcus sp. CCY9202]MEA5423126.1 glycosyltransferase family 61 protein [Synechococcus sp. CCY9202]